MAADRSKLIDSLRVEIELAEKAGANAAVIAKMDRDAQKIQRSIDRLNAKGPTESMARLEKAIEKMGGVGSLSADQTKSLTDQMERLAKAGAKIPASLQPAIDSVNKLRLAEAATAKEAVAAAQALEESSRRQAAAASESQELKAGLLDKAGLGALAGGMGPAAGVLLAAGAMAGVAKETFDLINSTAELADEVSNLATKYQISTDAVQQFQFMADRTGVSVDSFGQAIVNITKNLDEAPEKFKQWGMDVEHLRSLKPDELLGAMAEKLETLNESDRLTFAKELMKGVDLLPALLGGFDELAQKAAELGINLSSADIESLKGLRDSIDDVGSAWEGMWVQLGAALAQDQDVQDFFTALRDGIVGLADAIKENKHEIVNFAKILAGMSTGNMGLAAKGVRGLATGPGPVTYEWGSDPTIDPKKSPGQRTDEAAREAAEKKAEAARKKAHAEDFAALTAWIRARDAADRKHLDLMKAVFEGEAAMRLQLEARLANDARGSAYDDKAAFAAADRWNPRGGPITDTAGPALDEATMVREMRNALMRTDADKEKQLRLNKAVEESLRAQGKSEAEIARLMGTTVAHTMSWSQFLQTAANQLSAMGRSGQAIGKILGGVGGIGAMFEKGGTLNGVKGLGDLFKGSTGQVLGKLAGGATAALAAFDIGKTLYAMFHKTEAQKVAFDVGRDYGVKISEGLSKEIAEKSKTMGREAASLLSLDKIVAEGGGVQAFGVDKTIGKMRDLFSMIQTGKMTAEQARAPFDKLFGEVAQASISKTTGMVSLQVKELMALNEAMGMKSAAVSKFQNEQRAVAETILGRLTGNKDFKIASAEAGEALGAALAAQYARYAEQGLSGLEIAEKLGPQIDALGAKFDEAGTGGGEAFDRMLGKVQLFRDELTGPLAQGFEDVIGLSVALYNSGDLTKRQFQGLAGQAASQFAGLQAKMSDQGKDPNDAFELMAKDLQKLWEMQRRYNVELDDATKAMLAQAEEQGVVGQEFMDPLLREAELTNEILERGFTALGADLSDLRPRFVPPSDMSDYTPTGGGYGPGLEQAIAELAQSAGGAVGVGDAINPALGAMGDAIGAGLGALAGGVQTITTNVVLSNGAIVGSVRESVDRNTPEAAALITALAEKIKNRNGG